MMMLQRVFPIFIFPDLSRQELSQGPKQPTIPGVCPQLTHKRMKATASQGSVALLVTQAL